MKIFLILIIACEAWSSIEVAETALIHQSGKALCTLLDPGKIQCLQNCPGNIYPLPKPFTLCRMLNEFEANCIKECSVAIISMVTSRPGSRPLPGPGRPSPHQ